MSLWCGEYFKPGLALKRAFTVEGAAGLPVAHLALHTEGLVDDAFLRDRLLVAVNSGLLAALPSAAKEASKAAVPAAALAALVAAGGGLLRRWL